MTALWPEGGRLGLAVSGGPDSLALLLLAAAARPGQIEAATVDHGLRSQSAEEAANVARLCERLEVSHEILPVRVGPGNLQAEARAVRYAALDGWMRARELGALATAHHADDQVETLVMRLNRASGLSGLAGVRARTNVPGCGGILLRPLLAWRRADLGRIIADAGIDAADDASNRDARFDRARVRSELTGSDWIDVSAWARSAEFLADSVVALNWAVEREWESRVTADTDGCDYRPEAPHAIRLRVVSRIIAELGGVPARGSAVARLVRQLEAGDTATLAGVAAFNRKESWHFERERKMRRTDPA